MFPPGTVILRGYLKHTQSPKVHIQIYKTPSFLPGEMKRASPYRILALWPFSQPSVSLSLYPGQLPYISMVALPN